MKRLAHFALCLGAAIFLHAAGAVYLGALVGQPVSPVDPAFRRGETGIEMVFAMARPTAPKPPQQEMSDPVAAVAPSPDGDVAAPEPDPEPTPAPREPDFAPEPESEPVAQEETVVPDRDLPVICAEQGVLRSVAPEAVVNPRYPMVSRRRGEEGDVTVCAIVGKGGVAIETSVVKSSGYQALDRAALKAMEAARYQAENGAQADAGRIELTFKFQLKDRKE